MWCKLQSYLSWSHLRDHSSNTRSSRLLEVFLRWRLSSEAACRFHRIQEDWYLPQWEARRGTSVKLSMKQLHGKILLMVPANVISALHPRCPGRGVGPPGSPSGDRLVSRPGQFTAQRAGEKAYNKVRSTRVYWVKGRAVQMWPHQSG